MKTLNNQEAYGQLGVARYDATTNITEILYDGCSNHVHVSTDVSEQWTVGFYHSVRGYPRVTEDKCRYTDGYNAGSAWRNSYDQLVKAKTQRAWDSGFVEGYLNVFDKTEFDSQDSEESKLYDLGLEAGEEHREEVANLRDELSKVSDLRDELSKVNALLASANEKIRELKGKAKSDDWNTGFVDGFHDNTPAVSPSEAYQNGRATGRIYRDERLKFRESVLNLRIKNVDQAYRISTLEAQKICKSCNAKDEQIAELEGRIGDYSVGVSELKEDLIKQKTAIDDLNKVLVTEREKYHSFTSGLLSVLNNGIYTLSADSEFRAGRRLGLQFKHRGEYDVQLEVSKFKTALKLTAEGTNLGPIPPSTGVTTGACIGNLIREWFSDEEVYDHFIKELNAI